MNIFKRTISLNLNNLIYLAAIVIGSLFFNISSVKALDCTFDCGYLGPGFECIPNFDCEDNWACRDTGCEDPTPTPTNIPTPTPIPTATPIPPPVTGNFDVSCTLPQPEPDLSYTMVASDFQGGGNFEHTMFFLSFNGPYDPADPLDNYLGAPTWAYAGWHGYLIYQCQANQGCNPIDGSVTYIWDGNGNRVGGNNRSIDGIATWATNNLDPSYRFAIAANLRMGGVQNDGIGSVNVEISENACLSPTPTPIPPFEDCQPGGDCCVCILEDDECNLLADFCNTDLGLVAKCTTSLNQCEEDSGCNCVSDPQVVCGNEGEPCCQPGNICYDDFGDLECDLESGICVFAIVAPPEVFCIGGIGPVADPSEGTIYTAIGCIPTKNTQLFIQFYLRWGMGLAGGISFVLIVVSGFMIITAQGNPRKIMAGKQLLYGAITGLALFLFSVYLMRLIGSDILKIPGL